MESALLCREMGWTHAEYLDQPTWFLDQLMAMLSAESKEAERRNKKT